MIEQHKRSRGSTWVLVGCFALLAVVSCGKTRQGWARDYLRLEISLFDAVVFWHRWEGQVSMYLPDDDCDWPCDCPIPLGDEG